MRWRLLAAFLGVMALMLLAQDLPLAGHLREVERDRQLADLERDAFILSASASDALEEAPDGVNEDAAPAAVDLGPSLDMYAPGSGFTVLVTDAEGVVVAASASQTVGDDLAEQPDIASALTRTPAVGDGAVDGTDMVSIAVPVLSGAKVVGTVRVAAPASVIDERAGSKVRGLLLVGGISLAAAALAAIFMASSVTRPLRQLHRSTERVASGDFAERVDERDGPPEVRRLASSFNSMTQRVATLVDSQRSFAGDASHQLRTPLTALRLQLERSAALLENDHVAARDHLDAARAETERLQRLVDGLLMLARAEATSSPLPEPVDVDRVVDDRIAVWQPLAEEREIDITKWGQASVPALAAPEAVAEIVDNYLDNAIAVAPAGSTIEVVVDDSTESGIAVHVLDRGPGMSDEQLMTAFDRFWRAPGAHPDGSGLGLAIVSQLARASGATATLARRSGGGLDAVVTLRRA